MKPQEFDPSKIPFADKALIVGLLILFGVTCVLGLYVDVFKTNSDEIVNSDPTKQVCRDPRTFSYVVGPTYICVNSKGELHLDDSGKCGESTNPDGTL